jgi:hypothetical protein
MPLFTAQPGFDFTEGLPPGRNFGLVPREFGGKLAPFPFDDLKMQ